MQKLLILIEKVNKNYRLTLIRLYGYTVLNNHDFRGNSITNLEFYAGGHPGITKVAASKG